jgi:hypothetical protein
MNTAVLSSPNAFSFNLLKANEAADVMDASFKVEEEKGSNTMLDITSNCCGCRQQ